MLRADLRIMVRLILLKLFGVDWFSGVEGEEGVGGEELGRHFKELVVEVERLVLLRYRDLS